MKLANIEGIGDVHLAKLAQAGVKTPKGLLKKAETPELRKRLSDETGISVRQLLEWVNFANLLRVEGIGVEYAGLLEEIGIDTPKALAAQNAKLLAQRLKQSNEAKNRTLRLPSLNQLKKAIKSAAKVGLTHGFAGDHTLPPPPPPQRKKKRKTKKKNG